MVIRACVTMTGSNTIARMRRGQRRWNRPTSVPIVLPASADDRRNFWCAVRGLAGFTSEAGCVRLAGKRMRWLRDMANGRLPVSARVVNQLRDNFDDYRKTLLEQ